MLTRWIEKQKLRAIQQKRCAGCRWVCQCISVKKTGETQVSSIQQERRRQAQRLKRDIKRLITGELQSINPWWLISFHYCDHHSKEDELLQDVADLKRKLHRIIYKSRDKSIKGAGEYSYPRMLFSTKPATRAQVNFIRTSSPKNCQQA